MTQEVEEKVPRFDDTVITEDKTPNTWINEELWKKVLFKTLANFVYVVGLAIITNGIVAFDFNKFVTGLQVIILPVIWSGLDAQARNREIQARLASEEALAKAKAQADKEKEESERIIAELQKEAAEKQLEIYRLKAVLMAKTENVEAMQDALKKADTLMETAKALESQK